MNGGGTILDRDQFLAAYGYSISDLKAVGLDWSTLEQIRAKYQAQMGELESVGAYVSSRLRALPEVHSLKFRMKDPNSLLAKLLRKKKRSPRAKITQDSFERHITDLVGVRALHLFKGDWRPIHDFVLATWGRKERPTAYVRRGDPEARSRELEEAGCDVKIHPYGYRSVHYLIKSRAERRTRLVELQVRTIFEEGWSEIDHRLRYPQSACDSLVDHSLDIFNLLAGNADEMGTLIQALSTYISEYEAGREERESVIAAQEQKIKDIISTLGIRSAEKQALEEEVARLRKAYHQQSSLVGGVSVRFGELGTIPLSGLGNNLILGNQRSAVQKRCTVCNRVYDDTELTAGIAIGPDRCPECRGKPLLGQ